MSGVMSVSAMENKGVVMSAEQFILRKFLNEGCVNNYECIDKRVTTRLGAYIHRLRNRGLNIHTQENFNGTKNTFYFLVNAKEKARVKELLQRKKAV